MNVAASGVAVQIAQTRTVMAQDMIKANAQAERRIVDILTQAAEAGAKIASSHSINIIV